MIKLRWGSYTAAVWRKWNEAVWSPELLFHKVLAQYYGPVRRPTSIGLPMSQMNVHNLYVIHYLQF